MKKFLLMFGAFMAFNAMINAQTPKPDRSGGPASSTPTAATKAKPTDASGKSGSTKPAAKTTATKPSTSSTFQGTFNDHKCTAACKGGNHVLAHGEKGHVCTAGTAACLPHGVKGHVCTSLCVGATPNYPPTKGK